MHGPHRRIFVGGRPAKVNHEAIAEILRHIAVPGLQRRHRRLLVGPHHGAVVFGIEVLGQLRRVNQVAEQHRDLAAFGLRARASCLRYGGRRVLWHVCGDGVSGDGRLRRWRMGLGDAWRQGGCSGKGD
jgi:hypothetical protein